MNYSKTIDIIFEKALDLAIENRDNYFTPEHILYILVSENRSYINYILEQEKVNKNWIIGNLKIYLNKYIEKSVDEDDFIAFEMTETEALVNIKQILKNIKQHNSDISTMDELDILKAILEQEESYAYQLLNSFISKEKLLKNLTLLKKLKSLIIETYLQNNSEIDETEEQEINETIEKHSLLRTLLEKLENNRLSDEERMAILSNKLSKNSSQKRTIDEFFGEELEENQDEFNEYNNDEYIEEENNSLDFLIDMLKESHKYDEVIGREREIERVTQILSRRKKNNPILVGEAGVGKSAIVEGLAQMIKEKRVAPHLQNRALFRVDIGSLLAGTQYRGDVEDKIKAMFEKLKEYKNPIIFIDEIHMIIGAGATNSSAVDIANLLKPILSTGEISFIGATTYKEYKSLIEKDKAILRRFQKVDILEPSIKDSIKILEGLKDRYEQFHKVTYSKEAIKSAVELSKKYLREKHLPDSALDVIDEIGAKFKIENRKNIKKRDIEEIISKIANIPPESAKSNEIEKIRDLEEKLKSKIFHQDKAIKEVVKVIKRRKAGLSREEKPIGNFLFVGPTGVGKTEIAKQLSKEMGIEFIRFDMSEYQEKHSVAKLIGSPPGYVGFEQGGLLTEEIRKKPYAVLLLDEIEKAHPDIVQILLQVMDNATLKDNEGRVADFRNVILIMTSNLGVGEGSSIGFNKDKSDFKEEAIERFFAPEFLNRVDAVIKFNSLNRNSLFKVLDKFLEELTIKLTKKKITLSITQKAKEELIKRGYNSKMGARPMARVIENEIVEPLTDEILFGTLSKGGKVEIDFDSEFKFITKGSK